MPHHKASWEEAAVAREPLPPFSAVLGELLLSTLNQQSLKSPFYMQGATVGLYGVPKTLILFP